MRGNKVRGLAQLIKYTLARRPKSNTKTQGLISTQYASTYVETPVMTKNYTITVFSTYELLTYFSVNKAAQACKVKICQELSSCLRLFIIDTGFFAHRV